MDAAGVIAYYVMDGNRPLASDSAGNTTFFLYGLGPIGEKTTDWNFSLPDGTNTPRQLSVNSGDITLATRYTPWGNSLELHGTGNFTFGYIGSILDTATGLLYVGNGLLTAMGDYTIGVHIQNLAELIVGISVPNYYFAIPHNVIIESSSIDILSVDDTRYNPFGLKAK